MKRTVPFVLVMVLMCMLPDTVRALEMSADMISQMSGKTTNAKMYLSGMKSRIETRESIIVYRPDKNVMWILQPEEKMYMEMPLDIYRLPVTEEKMKGETDRTYIKNETLNGYETKKYEVIVRQGGKVEEYFQWVSIDLGLPIKTMAKDDSWSQEYRNISMTAPAELFDIPPDFEKLEMPGYGSGVIPEVPRRTKKQIEEEESSKGDWKTKLPKLPWP